MGNRPNFIAAAGAGVVTGLRGDSAWAKAEARHLLADVKATGKGGQYPYVTVLGCMDARTPPELIFDQGVRTLPFSWTLFWLAARGMASG